MIRLLKGLSFQNQGVNAFAALLTCTFLALVFALTLRGSSYKTMVPILFIAVIAAAAAQWGQLGAIAGALSAAAIFATLLFEPFGRLAVSSAAARDELGWMMLFGIVAAFLLSGSKRQTGASRDEQVPPVSASAVDDTSRQ